VNAELEALEASIDAAPDDASRYAVLGDWYAQQGDPRGELIALQLDRSGAKARREREAELLSLPSIRVPASRETSAQWRWGFVHTLSFAIREELLLQDEWQHQLSATLAHPNYRFMRELMIEVSSGDDALDYLADSLPRHVQALTLICNEVHLDRLTGKLAQLERVTVAAQLIVPAPLTLPRLRELALPIDALTIEGLRYALSGVRGLHKLTLSSLESIDRAAVIPATEVPGLESLTLRAESTSRSAVEAIVESPLRESLTTLDVSRSGLSEEGAQRLLKLTSKFERLANLVLGDAV
jgi:uncharacterized protein (TIGR02996 family)